MAQKLHTYYPDRFDAPSSEYPQGKWRNRSSSTAHDAGYLDQGWLNDQYGFLGKLLREGGITPDGTIDTALKSQYFDALVNVINEQTKNKRDIDDNVFDGYVSIKSDGTVKGNFTSSQDGIQVNNITDGGIDGSYIFPKREGVYHVAVWEDFNTAYSWNELKVMLNDGIKNIYLTSSTGQLEINSRLTIDTSNVAIEFDPSLTVIDNNKSGYTFNISGELEDEIEISEDVVDHSNYIHLKTTEGLKVGDWLYIKSQRKCAHPDATEEWRLGETTANTESPYFAERVQIEEVDGSGVYITSNLVFPFYYADSSRESEPTRQCTTVQKINFLENIHINVPSKYIKETGGGINCELIKDSKVSFGNAYLEKRGVFMTHRKCTDSVFELKHERPSDWVLESNHGGYNSLKDIGSWNCTSKLYDVNGCQGFDQTFTDNPTMFPKVYVQAVNNKEDAATTHGCSYGGEYYIDAVGCKLAGFRNRSRFINAHVNVDGSQYGVRASSYGFHDNIFKVYANRCDISFHAAHKGVTSTSHGNKNTTIDLYSRYAIGEDFRIESSVDEYPVNSNIYFNILKSKNSRRVMNIGENVLGVCVNELVITNDYPNTQISVWLNKVNTFNINTLILDVPDSDRYIIGGSTKSSESSSTSLQSKINVGNIINRTNRGNVILESLTSPYVTASAKDSNYAVHLDNNTSDSFKVRVYDNYRNNAVRINFKEYQEGREFIITFVPSDNLESNYVGFYVNAGIANIHHTNGFNGSSIDITQYPVVKATFINGNIICSGM